MSQLRDDGPTVYTNGSNTPILGDVISQSMDSATDPAAEAGDMGLSAPTPRAERKRTASRASSLLSSLSPPYSRRLGRASSVTKANGKLVVDLHDALRNTPSKESSLTTASQSLGEETSPTEEVTGPRSYSDQRSSDMERADTAVTAQARNGDLRKGMKRLSRRVSDAGVRKVNSAIGSFKRRMGMGHSAGEEAAPNTMGTTSEVSAFDSTIRSKRQSRGGNPETTLSLPKEDSGRGLGRTPSIRDKWKRSKAPATDTFEFATTFSSKNGSMREDEHAMMDSPIALPEGDSEFRKLPSGASSRPPLQHTTSTPLRFGASLQQREDNCDTVIEPSTIPREDLGALDDISVPHQWLTGTEMYKVSHKGTKRRKFILDPDQGFILWKSKKSGIIRIENITELRPGSRAKYNMEQLNYSDTDEDRWLTITYLADEKYKTLHLVALTPGDLKSFYETLDRLRALRMAMLSLPSDPHLAQIPHPEPPETKNLNCTAEANGVDAVNLSPKLLPVHGGHKHLTNEQRQNLWERHYWKGADVSVDGRVDLQEIKRMAHRLSIDVLSQNLEFIFNETHHSGDAGMNFEEFKTFWRRLRTRGDIQIIWNRLTGEDKLTASFETFERFMRTEQKDNRSTEELKRVFAHYASNSSDTGANSVDTKEPESPVLLLTLEGFTAYLMSLDNAPFGDQSLGIYHDMDRPLSEYYISSSHNTYLVGHQLVGESTIEGYIRALLNGCRCVEIDIYDGDKEPVITHGGTLTSKIALRAICEAIEKSAFVTSPYPVIISAEVHCGVAQQRLIAEIMKEVFKEKLVDERIDGTKASEPLKQLPSPRMLMNRILLKTKNPTLAHETAVEMINTEATGPVILAETDGGTSTGFTSDPEPMTPERRGSFSLTRGRRGSKSHAPTPAKPIVVPPADKDTTRDSLGGPSLQGPRSPSSSKTKAFSPALADLLVYTVGVKCRGINKKERYAVEHMFSLSEKKMDKMLKEGSMYYAAVDDVEHANVDGGVSGGMLDLIKHTQTHLVRTYPKGTRLNSTNYHPHRYWAAGAQLVAINWQTSDLGSMINQAMFLRNGRSGYVLKPASLRPGEHKIKDVVSRRKTYALDVTIISAQQLPRPRDRDGRDIIDKSTMDPYVRATLYVPDWPGVPKSALSQEEKETLTTQVTAQSTTLRKSSSLRRSMDYKPASGSSRYVLQSSSTPAKVIRVQTDAVKNNGFNPTWQTCLRLKFEVAGDMLDLVFIRFSIRNEGDAEDERALAMYCTSLGSLKQGYRHLPLHDQQMTQYLFSTLFIHTNLREINA